MPEGSALGALYGFGIYHNLARNRRFRKKMSEALLVLAEPFFFRRNFMRNIKECVSTFLPLLNTEYEIVLGRKGVSVTLKIGFNKRDCFHLIGLQYLIDRPELNRDRKKVFDEIVAGNITTEQVETSDFYKKIEERVNFLPLLEQLLDSNNTVFKYNKKANVYSMIDADYLMKNRMEERKLYLFLAHGKDNKYFCRSFFPEEKKDYTKNQASWTMLYKKKCNLSTGKEIVLYDRLMRE